MSTGKRGLTGPRKSKPGKPKKPFPKKWLQAKPEVKDLGHSWDYK